MLFTTTTQWIALIVALVAGWFFGLASHPGGRKWKERYAAERDAHAATTRRVAELEAEKGELLRRPVVAQQPAPVTHDAAVVHEVPRDEQRHPAARSAAEPAFRDPPRD